MQMRGPPLYPVEQPTVINVLALQERRLCARERERKKKVDEGGEVPNEGGKEREG